MLYSNPSLHRFDCSLIFYSSISVFSIFLLPLLPSTMLAITLNNFHSHDFWQHFLSWPAYNRTICFSLSLPPFFLFASFLIFLPFAMLAGSNLPADISIPWHSANWQHCRRERQREGENERKLVNNRRSERTRGKGRVWIRKQKRRQWRTIMVD